MTVDQDSHSELAVGRVYETCERRMKRLVEKLDPLVSDRKLKRTSIEVRRDVHDTYAAWQQGEISQLVWAHPAITHSHYKNPAGKVYTLSPWPLDQYRELTETLRPEEYVIG